MKGETVGEALERLAIENALKIESASQAQMFASEPCVHSLRWSYSAVRALEILSVEVNNLQMRIYGAPAAMMDTRVALGVCALKEEDFLALQALQGKRVRLVIDDKQGE